jgi:hypothetical protein
LLAPIRPYADSIVVFGSGFAALCWICFPATTWLMRAGSQILLAPDLFRPTTHEKYNQEGGPAYLAQVSQREKAQVDNVSAAAYLT